MTNTAAPVSRLAGAPLVGGAGGFIVVFSILAERFGYPDVLSRPATEVLPALVAGGAALRAVWFVYAALPLTIILAALLAHRSLPFATTYRALVTSAGVLAGALMAIGLVRWPTLQWELGTQWVATNDDIARASLATRFDALNVWLGNVVGEFLGEMGLTTWLAGVGLALRRTWVGRATLVLAAFMLVGAFRNVLPVTAFATDVTNGLLPAVMIWLGLVWALRGVQVKHSVVALAATAFVMASTGQASASDDRELMVNGFRSPSMGLELRDGWLGFHLGFYPTIVDNAPDGAARTTWFAKTGATAYLYRFDTGSGRPSSPFISVALLQGLNNAWDVSKSAAAGTAVSNEVGFRWAAGDHVDVRLGVALLTNFDGTTKINPTPGVSWSIPL